MHDFLTLGPAPHDEDCAQVGTPGYRARALDECRRFILLLRQICGPELADARLATKWFKHDFGEYVEVVCYFDTDIPESMDYAYRCEAQAPATWEG